MSEIKTNRNLQFNFNTSEIRVIVDKSGDPWFVAADGCSVLEHTNPSMAIKILDNDERAKLSLGRQGKANCVSESGLYALIFTSRKPEAKRFRKWITSEVLPSLRKTGQYKAHWWKARHASAASYKVLSDVLKITREQDGKETQLYHYVNESKLINWALTRPLCSTETLCRQRSWPRWPG